MTKWKPPDPNQDLQGEKDPIYAIVLAWEREKKNRPSISWNFASLDAMDTSAISRNQVYSSRFHTGSKVFSESWPEFLNRYPCYLVACLGLVLLVLPCSVIFAYLISFYSLRVKGNVDWKGNELYYVILS